MLVSGKKNMLNLRKLELIRLATIKVLNKLTSFSYDKKFHK